MCIRDSAISVSTALVFPVIRIGVFWPLGLTGLWLNFAGTAVLAGIPASDTNAQVWPSCSRATISGPCRCV